MTGTRRTVLMLAVVGATLLGASGVAHAQVSSDPDADSVRVNGRVSDVLVVGNRVYLGGSFTRVNGNVRNHLAAVDARTGRLTGWKPSANGDVLTLEASSNGTVVYAGGEFTRVNGRPRGRLVALSRTTGTVRANWTPSASGGDVEALAFSGGRIYAGGEFTRVDGRGRQRLAAVTTSGKLTGWAPRANARVRALALSPSGGRVFVGGAFTFVNGVSRPYLAALRAEGGGNVGGFRPGTLNGTVYDLAVSSNRVYAAAGGPGGAATAHNLTTGRKAWSRSANGDAQAITFLDGTVYVGGHFNRFANEGRRAFAAVNAGSGAVTPWNPGASPDFPGVWALTADRARTRIYAGGDFQSVAGESHPRFARFSQR